MNREIKFRAWDKVKKEMNYKVLVGNTDINDPNYTCNSILTKEPVRWVNADHNCIDLMQYTGLTDKNGKEIYEGDIVKYYNKYSKQFYTHIVLWDDKWAAFGLFEHGNQWCKENDWVKITEIEVIGNQFETPELLTT